MYSPFTQGGSVCKWVDDSQHLILEYLDKKCKSPSQIYHSALPWCPSSTWLHKHYPAELLQVLKVVKGAKAEWEKCSCTVSLGSHTWALSYWNNTIAAGSVNGDITILDATTGGLVAILSGHLQKVNCVTFSSDGKLLVSGSKDKTVKLWDMQTGGVVKTFYGHTWWVWCVSISADCTRIASGSGDNTIHLWDVQRGKSHCVIKQQDAVWHVSFSPIDPQSIISISGNEIWQWDIDGHQIPSIYSGTYIAFSPDHTQFALCNGKFVTVQNSNPRAIVAEFQIAGSEAERCCFSPDGRLVAAAAGKTIYVWDITSPDLHPVETLVGHTDVITSPVFSSPSSLSSASYDGSIRFWKIGVLSNNPVAADPESTSPILGEIQAVNLQVRAGIAISSHADGMVKTWDISTGFFKASFQTPADDVWRNAQMIDGKLITLRYQDDKMHIWDTNEGELLKTVTLPPLELKDIKISGDRSKVFHLTTESIQAWSIHTGELVGEVEKPKESQCFDPLQMNDSRIWIQPKDSSIQGWDFGIPDSPPVQLSDASIGRPLLDLIVNVFQSEDPFWIKNTDTGKEVFQLSGRYATPQALQWDGQYLVAGYKSGEVLILDFHHICTQ
jgi:WD40 repeat protein